MYYIPRIEVSISDYSFNAKIITDLLFQTEIKNTSLPFEERILRMLPELNTCKFEDKTYTELFDYVESLIQQYYYNNHSSMLHRMEELNDSLNRFLVPVIREMLDLFCVKWPFEQDKIICNIGLYPVFPRDVIQKEYWIHYQAPVDIVNRASVHEINHFILFEKWKVMHGYTYQQQPIYPDVMWFLEEMAVDPTLSCPRMQKISPYEQRAYQKFYDNKINGIVIQDYINKFFLDSKSIEEFLDISYQFINQHHGYLIESFG